MSSLGKLEKEKCKLSCIGIKLLVRGILILE